jgi:RNA polymerase sigma-70 factor, ECF subfamily
MLLVLRIDRNLSWRDIAIVMEGENIGLDETLTQKAETRFRKRFERIKDKLRELAVAQGLI